MRLRARLALVVLRVFTRLARPLITSNRYVELLMMRAALHFGLKQYYSAAATMARAIATAQAFEMGWANAPEMYAAAARVFEHVGWRQLANESHAKAQTLARGMYSAEFARVFADVEAPAALLAEEAAARFESEG